MDEGPLMTYRGGRATRQSERPREPERHGSSRACVGVRGQGQSHIRAYGKMPNVEIAAICDVDESILEQRLSDAEKLTNKRPAGRPIAQGARRQVHRRYFDRDAESQPRPAGHLGLQAGKDVYVEKPCAYNIFEAKQLLAASRKYGRMVQHGTNGRSSAVMQEAVQKVREGVIGDVYLSRGLCYKWRNTIGRTPVDPCPPASTTISGWALPPNANSRGTDSITISTGSGTTGTAISATRVSTRSMPRAGCWVSSIRPRSAPWADISVRRRPGDSEHDLGQV